MRASLPLAEFSRSCSCKLQIANCKLLPILINPKKRVCFSSAQFTISLGFSVAMQLAHVRRRLLPWSVLGCSAVRDARVCALLDRPIDRDGCKSRRRHPCMTTNRFARFNIRNARVVSAVFFSQCSFCFGISRWFSLYFDKCVEWVSKHSWRFWETSVARNTCLFIFWIFIFTSAKFLINFANNLCDRKYI